MQDADAKRQCGRRAWDNPALLTLRQERSESNDRSIFLDMICHLRETRDKMNRHRTMLFFAVILSVVLGTMPIACDDQPDNEPPAEPTINTVGGVADSAIDQPIDPTLRWSCSDPEGDPLTYDVYFGINSDPSLMSGSQAVRNYSPDTLAYATTYYWRILAKDDHDNSTSSLIWRFTTIDSGATLSIPTLNASGSDTVIVPVMAMNLTAMAGLQLHIQHESQHMTYDTVTSSYLDGIVSNAVGGTVHIAWANLADPVSLADGDTLVYLHFSNVSGPSPLTFVGNNEVVDTAGNRIDAVFVDGSVE